MKLIRIANISMLLSSLAIASVAQPTAGKNYIIANTVKQAGVTNEAYIPGIPVATQGKGQTIAYFDGLGQPLQTVITQGSANAKDIIMPVEYDAFGRELKKYLPYVETSATSGYGSYRPTWQATQAGFYIGVLQGVDTSTKPYSQSVLEPSPLSRVLAQGAPGSVWQPNLTDPYDTNRRVIKIKYEINKTRDSVRLFRVDTSGGISSPGFYAPGQLSIKTSIDEHNGITKEYNDKVGHVILKRVFIESDSLQTYYIYDDVEMLRAVIQPEGVSAISGSTWTADADFMGKWMFLYRYDGRNRMLMKKVPGADSVLMIYDQWDRVVLTQDGNLRTQNHWLFTKYDRLNRPVVTGQITDTRSQSTIRAVLDTASARYEAVNTSVDEGYTLNRTFPFGSSYTLTLYTITHYDSYDSLPSWKSSYGFVLEDGIPANITNVQGQVVAIQMKILNSSSWLRSVMYYNDKYWAIQTTGDNPVGGKDRITKVLTFDGKVSQQYQSHTSSFYVTAIPTVEGYTYDHADRVLSITHQIGTQEAVTVAQNAYNELGQLLNKKIRQSASHPSYLQKLDYTYNIRGWLNGINQPYSDETGYDESDLFNFALHYDVTHMDNATAQYNGNISETLWKGGYDEYLRGYEYTYDKANRLTKANYGFKYLNIYSSEVWDFSMKYNEQIYGYDHNGNIKRLGRWHGSFTEVDDLNYSKYDGNKLLNVWDGAGSANAPVGFIDVNNFYDDYRYDQNGNMTGDLNKNIDSIHYNHLNLPDTIHVSGKGGIKYTYDATGNKLQKTVTDTTGGHTTITTYKYAGAFVYKNDTLELVNHEEGRLRPLKIDTTQGFSPANLRYTYDYFMKDHLGNVRMVLTTEQQNDLYAATMETAAATKEEQLFTNLTSTRTTKPSGFDSNTGNGQVARLNGDINMGGNHRVGPALIIKVMAGDTISLATRAWYSGSTQAPPSGLTPIADELVSLLTGGLESAGATHGGATAAGDISGGVGDIIPDFLTNSQPYNSSRPKAFLNWMVVDEEFKKVTSANHMGAVQVPSIGSGDTAQALIGPSNMVVRRGGWLYVFVSNESNEDVYFDNIVVSHKHGPVLEQSDYYAFGLEIPGLSSNANTETNYPDNRYKFTGKEIQDKEFSEGTGLQWEDFGWRMYDAQIGRFLSIDAKAADFVSYTPYNYAFNNPVNVVDPDGTTGAPIVDTKSGTVTIKSTLWMYGGAATQGNADKVAKAIQDGWNAAGATMYVNNGDGQFTEYSVKFEVAAQVATENDVDHLMKNPAPGENFVRLEEKGTTHWDYNTQGGGGNTGFISMEDVNNSPTTVLHEYGHGLGWYDASQLGDPNSRFGTHDIKGEITGPEIRIPTIMTPRGTPMKDMENRMLPNLDESYFKNGIVDPNRRAVTQRVVFNVLRNFDLTHPAQQIGTNTNLVHGADGHVTKKVNSN